MVKIILLQMGDEEHTVDLTLLKILNLKKKILLEKGKNEFEFTLPTTQKGNYI
jgi:hypothetical protein